MPHDITWYYTEHHRSLLRGFLTSVVLYLLFYYSFGLSSNYNFLHISSLVVSKESRDCLRE